MGYGPSWIGSFIGGIDLTKLQHFQRLTSEMSGEGGIRTPDTVTRMPHFECGAFNHSATSPWPQKGQISPSVGGYVSNARRLNKSGDVPCNRSSWRPRADRGT